MMGRPRAISFSLKWDAGNALSMRISMQEARMEASSLERALKHSWTSHNEGQSRQRTPELYIPVKHTSLAQALGKLSTFE